ncbi:MAG TPA: hypothetical protein VLN59_06355 [Burkholderiales bacterium]|nr:hypothetical protein [Burkholderiales bacterium]
MSWRFIALPTQISSEYVWYWRREKEKGKPEEQSSRTFSFYYECLEDARQHGYSGLPPQLQTFSALQKRTGDAKRGGKSGALEKATKKDV